MGRMREARLKDEGNWVKGLPLKHDKPSCDWRREQKGTGSVGDGRSPLGPVR